MRSESDQRYYTFYNIPI